MNHMYILPLFLFHFCGNMASDLKILIANVPAPVGTMNYIAHVMPD